MSKEDTRRFHIVTGGPGAGKSSLIAALASKGLATMPEAGRAIIRHQSAIDGPALPWRAPAAFAEQMLGWEMRSHEQAREVAGPVLFDRGVPDIIGYLELTGVAVPTHVEEAARRFRYNETVFIAPPWEAIYRRDSERRKDFAEAEATFRALAAAYTRLGYRLLQLPCLSVDERVRFVRARLG